MIACVVCGAKAKEEWADDTASRWIFADPEENGYRAPLCPWSCKTAWAERSEPQRIEAILNERLIHVLLPLVLEGKYKVDQPDGRPLVALDWPWGMHWQWTADRFCVFKGKHAADESTCPDCRLHVAPVFREIEIEVAS